LTLETEAARQRFTKVRARFQSEPPVLSLPGVMDSRREGRELDFIMDGAPEALENWSKTEAPEAVVSEGLSLGKFFSPV
jgi:hypothetical protein